MRHFDQSLRTMQSEEITLGSSKKLARIKKKRDKETRKKTRPLDCFFCLRIYLLLFVLLKFLWSFLSGFG